MVRAWKEWTQLTTGSGAAQGRQTLSGLTLKALSPGSLVLLDGALVRGWFCWCVHHEVL